MPPKANANKSSKRSVSRPRAASRGRPRKRSESPEVKSEERATSRGRGRVARKTTNTSPRRASKSPSASRARRAPEDTPRGAPGIHENAVGTVQANELRGRVAQEVRIVRAETVALSTSASSRGHRSTGKSWSHALLASLQFDFFGPLGSGALMLFLPPTIFAMTAVCAFSAPGTKAKGVCSLSEIDVFSNNSKLCDALENAVRDLPALYFVVGWLVLQAALYILPIGNVVDGYDPRERLRYRINLPHALIISLHLLVFTVVYLKFDVFGFLVAHLFGIVWWSTVIAFTGAVVLFVAGRHERTNAFGNTGWLIQDYFMGRTRNPRIRRWKWLSLFDFKMFFELRPGMLLWALLAASYFAVHYREVRAADTVTPWYGVPVGLNYNLALLVFFQIWYIFDASFNEQKILSTFDIVSEGFGFMLLYGDMVFLPFLYSVNVRYLLASLGSLSATAQSPVYLAFLTVLHTIGFFVYRLSNNAKHAFRTNPNAASLAHLRTITVNGGRKILVDGWWGISRHPNYIGDLLMSWSWALLCGWPTNLGAFALIYFYPFFVTVLLVTRAVRDDTVRREKYGETAWKRYCEQVKWRIAPYIF